MIFDSHIHINVGASAQIGVSDTKREEVEELQSFKRLIETSSLGVLANAGTVEEYIELEKINNIYISFGIHPWLAGKMEITKDLHKYYEKAHVIGEIGLDSVWCNNDIEIQREIFDSQLEIAEKLCKPIVLHTKGQEKEISEKLKSYTMNKLIHWYSCEEHLEEFIKQDCYFTVGPNFRESREVKAVIEKVPIDRLLVETDGINAVEWATGMKTTADEIVKVLRASMVAISRAKCLRLELVEKKLEENFFRFIKNS